MDRGTSTGELNFLHKQPHPGIQAMSSDGRFGYGVDSVTNRVLIFKREAPSEPFEATGEVALGEAEDVKRAGSWRETIRLSPDGRHAYAIFSTPFDSSKLGASRFQLVTLKRDTTTGKLEKVGSVEHGKDGISFDQPYHVAISPTGIRLYVMAAAAANLSIFRRDPATGELDYELTQTLESKPGDRFAVIHPTGMAVSPDGQQVYVADSKDAPTILRFEPQP